MIKNKKYYRSEDGLVFIENGDKYVPHLSKKEVHLYTKSPEKFKTNFLKNVRFYVTFINWLHKLQKKTNFLNPREYFSALLSILYLFQRGMDYHYYHFDRYLAYQNYSDTPVGFWWNKLKNLTGKIARKKGVNENELFLNLLSNDKNTIKLCQQSLDKKSKLSLRKGLKNIGIFQSAQKKEVELIIDFKTKENTLFRTVVPIWNELMELLKNHQEFVKKESRSEIPKIISAHPIIMTRVILSPKGLQYFQSDIVRAFEDEIKRWIIY